MHTKSPIFLITFLLYLQLRLQLINCQLCLLPNCLSCSTPYQCLACPPDLQCCQQQCIMCVQQTMCMGCRVGYVLNSSGNVCQVSNSTQQLACAFGDQVCEKCVSGYILNPYTFYCEPCPVSCEICKLESNHHHKSVLSPSPFPTPLSQSSQPLQLSSSEHSSYSSPYLQTACTFCQLTYFLNSSTQTCQSCNTYMPYCDMCSNATICISCEFGFYLVQTAQICGFCGDNCKICYTLVQCKVCYRGYYLDQQSKCKACAQECQQCFGTADNCTECFVTEYVLNGTCAICNYGIPFCISCVLNGTQLMCVSCPPTMILVGGVCKFCPLYCATCSNLTSCLSCITGYFLQNKLCTSCQIPQCLECFSQTNCQNCNTFFYQSPDNTLCLPCSSNCQQCTSSSQCSSCNDFYVVSAQGTCIACPLNCQQCNKQATQCYSCSAGFHTPQYDGYGNCVPCPPYCTDCQTQFQCRFCSPGTYLYLQICMPCSDPNCYDCPAVNNGTICLICLSQYFLNSVSNSCESCLPGCAVCQNASICIACQSQFYMNQSLGCSLCPSNCLSCVSASYCTQCAYNFYLGDGSELCYKCSIGCESCTSSSYCLTCSSRYYLSINSALRAYQFCVPCQSPYYTCSAVMNCSQCLPRYYMIQGQCQPCPAGCLTCVYGYFCQHCDSGYALIRQGYTGVCKQCGQGCQQCKHIGQGITQCTQCQPKLTLQYSGSCLLCGSTPQTTGCSQCNQYGLCTNCYPNYTLNSTTSQCQNNNYETVITDQFYMFICIGLGTLAMILLILMLVIKISGRNKVTGLYNDNNNNSVLLDNSQLSQ